MGTAAAPPQPQLLLSFATYLLLLSSWCSENVESVWFRAVLIPQHKFQQLGGGRPPTPMTLQLCRSPKKFVPTCRDWKWEKGVSFHHSMGGSCGNGIIESLRSCVSPWMTLNRCMSDYCQLDFGGQDSPYSLFNTRIFSRKNLIQLSTYLSNSFRFFESFCPKRLPILRN